MVAKQPTSCPLPPLPPLGKSVVAVVHGPLVALATALYPPPFQTPIGTLLKAEYRDLPDDQIAAKHLDYAKLMELQKGMTTEMNLRLPDRLYSAIEQPHPALTRTVTVLKTTVASQQTFEKAIDALYAHAVKFEKEDGPAHLVFVAGYKPNCSCPVRDGETQVVKIVNMTCKALEEVTRMSGK